MLSQQNIQRFISQALKEAQLAMDESEVPVGCVFVQILHEDKFEIVKRAHNNTNRLKNASAHAQMICLKELEREGRIGLCPQLYLFVTVQPCIMCAKALEIVGIREVYFGQHNERFGGCGSVLTLNSYKSYGGYGAISSNALLKTFYEKGNESLPEEQRHRKRVKL